MDNLDAQPKIYDTVSVLDAYAGDPGVFFRPAQAVSGLIEPTYNKVATGCLTWRKKDTPTRSNEPITDVDYPEVHPARFDWMTMRQSAGWKGKENLAASEYEGDFIAPTRRTKVPGAVPIST